MTDGVVISLGEGRCLRTRDGRMMPVDYTLAPIRDDHGLTIGCVVIFRGEHDPSRSRESETSGNVTKPDANGCRQWAALQVVLERY